MKIEAREKDVSFTLKAIYDRRMEIRGQLESLVMTHRWTLREIDLWNYVNALRETDETRVDDKFVDSEGNKPHGQYSVRYPLGRVLFSRRYYCTSSDDAMDSSFRQASLSLRSSYPLQNKLSTIKRCLNKVLKSFTTHGLCPYQLALYQIDQTQKGGKFVSSKGRSVPGGARDSDGAFE
ncbi:hypothetical protein FRB95_004613 [Tulasnella sp. JGI-2019a]|nr:hypothetical protein FRB95_004613 [Tulasnella sp. JGI-2019a]